MGFNLGATTAADNGLLLEMIGTASGLILHASDTLSSSGTLVVEGATTIHGATLIDLTSGFLGLEIIEVGSGTVLHASDTLSSSGNIVVTKNVVMGSGAITIDDNARTGTGLIIDSEVELGVVLALDSATGATNSKNGTGSQAPHILFGYLGTFDTSLYRASGSTLRTDDMLLLTSTNAENRTMLKLDTEETAEGQNVLEIISDVSGDDDRVLRITASGAVISDAAYNSQGADYAEWFFAGQDRLQPGEMVCIDIAHANRVRRCIREADSNIMGIISSKPAFIGNSIDGANGLPPQEIRKLGYALVGLIGQVPAQAIVEEVSVSDGNGGTVLLPIRPGDSLTSASRPGYARRALPGESTVGVALEALASGEGIVNVLISRRNSSMTVEAVEEKVIETVAAMEIEDEVQLLISSAVANLNLNDDISLEVGKQLDTFDIAQRVRDALAEMEPRNETAQENTD